MAPNNSFKPNLLRYGKSVAEKACHAFVSTTQVGLTQALGAQVKLPQLSIDISRGAIAIGGTDALELLGRLYSAHPHQQSETIHLGDAMLGDIPVSVFGRRKPYVFQVAVKPPATLDFEQSDKRAAEICGAIAKLSSVAPKSLCPKLSWGSVTLLSEWRDGGWGAIFDIAQRT